MQGNTTEIDERNLLRLDALLSHGYGLPAAHGYRQQGTDRASPAYRDRRKAPGFIYGDIRRYCKVILRNEARDAYDQRKRKLKREQLFGEMSPEELNKLITTDRYFQFERDIVEDGLHFIVCDQGVYDALMTLPGAKRKIVLLSYFGEMNDREIGDALGTGRANVQYHRSRALAMMRKTLEQESEEY